MESKDGWSGSSRSESKRLWDANSGESLWSSLTENYAACDMSLDNTGNLLSAANEVALDILRASFEFSPNTRINLVEDLQNVRSLYFSAAIVLYQETWVLLQLYIQ